MAGHFTIPKLIGLCTCRGRWRIHGRACTQSVQDVRVRHVWAHRRSCRGHERSLNGKQPAGEKPNSLSFTATDNAPPYAWCKPLVKILPSPPTNGGDAITRRRENRSCCISTVRFSHRWWKTSLSLLPSGLINSCNQGHWWFLQLGDCEPQNGLNGAAGIPLQTLNVRL